MNCISMTTLLCLSLSKPILILIGGFSSFQYVQSIYGGLATRSHMTYELVTTPYKWKVKRQDKDIQDLRYYLARMFP
jgi:hypothetical protein